jgi:hypothetical protein
MSDFNEKESLPAASSEANLLRSHYEAVLQDQESKARKRSGAQYWSSGNTNVGEDELAAVDFARAVLADPAAFASLEALELAIMAIRARYVRVFPDLDGFGGSTFYDIVRGVRGRVGSDRTDFPEEPDDFPTSLDDTQSAETSDAFEISQLVDDSLFHARVLRNRNENLLAFDFLQLHVIAVALQISRNRAALSDSDVLLMARRLKEAQSFAFYLTVEGRFPKLIYNSIYRYITGTSFLLTFIQEGSRNADSYPPGKFKIPFRPLALDHTIAAATLEERKSDPAAGESDEGSTHLSGFLLATRLEEIASSADAEFLHGMFVDVLENVSPDWDDTTILHYVRVAAPLSENGRAKFGPLQFDQNEILACFVLRVDAADGGLVTTVALLDRYEYVAPILMNTREAAIAFVGGDKESFRDGIVELAGALLNPLVPLIVDCPTIVVIAEGIMSAVPFSGLPVRLSKDSDPTFLVQTHCVINAISPRSLLRSRPSRIAVSGNGVAVFNPDFNARSDDAATSIAPIFEQLPETEAEGKQLSSRYDWKSISGADATAQQLSDSLSSFSIVHIASHGDSALSNLERDSALAKNSPSRFSELYEEAQRGSFIACAGANVQVDARLTCADLAQMDLRNVDLAYLSLCLGAVGDAFAGETSFSLSRSFVSSGAKCVISSSFPVADVEARDFALEYYSRLKEAVTAVDSLRLTQMQFIEEKRNWLDWAGYQIWV